MVCRLFGDNPLSENRRQAIIWTNADLFSTYMNKAHINNDKSQCWLISTSPKGVTRPQWVNLPVSIVCVEVSLSLCKCSSLNTFSPHLRAVRAGCLLLNIRGRRYLRNRVTMLHSEPCHVSASFWRCVVMIYVTLGQQKHWTWSRTFHYWDTVQYKENTALLLT